MSIFHSVLVNELLLLHKDFINRHEHVKSIKPLNCNFKLNKRMGLIKWSYTVSHHYPSCDPKLAWFTLKELLLGDENTFTIEDKIILNNHDYKVIFEY